ncbi:MAG TPA: PIN domain-containing protein [Candidatus Limnocylindria bacterium]|nr:PIN domain-containing protein [Candidatus Limnocylindria bacterium]
MGTLLDTSILIDIERAQRVVATDEDVAIAAITASELLQGVLRADQAHRLDRESFVEGILASIPTIPFSLRVARIHAELWAQLASRGRRIDAHDLQIASTAVSLGWSLATLDRRHFSGVPGLRLADRKT